MKYLENHNDIIEEDTTIDSDDNWAGITVGHFKFLATKCKAPIPYALKTAYFLMSNPTQEQEKQYYLDLNKWGWITNLTLTKQAHEFFDTLADADYSLTAQIRVNNMPTDHNNILENGVPELWEGTELPLLINPVPLINAAYYVNTTRTESDTIEYNITCFYTNADDVSIFTITTEGNPYHTIASAYLDLIDPDGNFPPTTIITKPIKANKNKLIEKSMKANEIYREKLLWAQENGEEYKGTVYDIMKNLPDNGAMSFTDERTLAKLVDDKGALVLSSSFIVTPDFSNIPKDWRIIKNMTFTQPLAVDVTCYHNRGMVVTIPSEIQPDYCFFHPFSIPVLTKGLQLLVENTQPMVQSPVEEK